MTRQAQPKRWLTKMMRFQNGEIEIVERFTQKILGKETFKGAILRLMRKEL